jgi:hypothetical protein
MQLLIPLQVCEQLIEIKEKLKLEQKINKLAAIQEVLPQSHMEALKMKDNQQKYIKCLNSDVQ